MSVSIVKKVGIVGLGLMGGSFALALKNAYKDVEITGYDHNDQHCIEALELDLADKITDDLSDFDDFDLIILAIPVEGIVSVLKSLQNISPNTTVIDFGSTKKYIIDSTPPALRKNLVASHPMTGTEKFGPSAAKKDLYRGKVVVICDIADSGSLQSKTARKIFGDIGMKIFYMRAEEHDLHAAFISHMPHALSFSLANAVMKQENPEAIIALAGGGFRDMSRIAKSSPAMWVDIFRQNRENISLALECFQEELSKCGKLLQSEKWDELFEWMKEANRLHGIL